MFGALATRHPNLIVALLGPDCARPWGPHTTVSRGNCRLLLLFRRLGTLDRAGVPEDLEAPVEGDLDDGRVVASAIARLSPIPQTGVERSRDELTDIDEEGLVRVSDDGNDPEARVRVHTAIYAIETREALQRCASQAYVSYDVRWTLSPTGTVTHVDLNPITGPDASAANETSCVEQVLQQMPFSCSARGRVETAHAHLCLRR